MGRARCAFGGVIMDHDKGAPPLPTKLSPQGIRGYFETRACIKSYVSVLETAAAGLEKDRAKSAHEALAATITFLIAIRQPRHVLAPLVEAAEIVQREMNVKGAVTLDVANKVLQSIAVSLQIEDGVSMNDALRNVVGHDPVEATSLKNFRKNMLAKDTPRGARDYYYLTLRSDFRDMPPEEAAKKALVVCSRLRGKKA
jgi:hypothetical protein